MSILERHLKALLLLSVYQRGELLPNFTSSRTDFGLQFVLLVFRLPEGVGDDVPTQDLIESRRPAFGCAVGFLFL